MPVSARYLLISVLALAATGCQPGPDEHQANFRAFQTGITVSVRGVETRVAEQAFARLERDFGHMHRQWQPHQQGALRELNHQLPDGGWVSTTPDMIELIERAQDLEQRSGGLFNAALGRVTELWRPTIAVDPEAAHPTDEAVAAILVHQPTALDVTTGQGRVRSTNRAVAFDFSSIVEGLATLRACERLADFRITDALIEIGGNAMVCGADERPWRVTIDDPAGERLTTVDLRQRQAVFTRNSFHPANHESGKRPLPVLDPDTGHPVEHAMQVTVIDNDPVLADAAATALVIAGPIVWQSIAGGMAVDKVMIVDAEGQVAVSDGLEELL